MGVSSYVRDYDPIYRFGREARFWLQRLTLALLAISVIALSTSACGGNSAGDAAPVAESGMPPANDRLDDASTLVSERAPAVASIGLDPANLPPPIADRSPKIVRYI